MTEYNDRIVAAARGWIGTRFHHQGRLKRTYSHKGGVDCLGLLVGVAGELDLYGPEGKALTFFDETDYAHFPDNIRLRSKLSELLAAIPTQGIRPGDILLLNIDNHPQHLAIASMVDGKPAMIHAYAPARAVVEHVMDEYWFARMEAAFRYQ